MIIILEFQHLLITAIITSVCFYIYLSLHILDNTGSASVYINKITGVATVAIFVTASIVLKGILLNVFLGINNSQKEQSVFSIIILICVILASFILINNKNLFYYYTERMKLVSISIITILIFPLNYISFFYYISSIFLSIVVGMFGYKCFYKYKIKKNVGLYFLFISTSAIVLGIILSYFFEALFFNTFVLALLLFLLVGFFIFYISFFHAELSSRIEKLIKQEEVIKDKNKELKKIIYTDDVIGIPNRIAFERDILMREESCYVGLLNIHDFMGYNKLLGFDRGNEILIELAGLLNKECSEKIALYRYYSDKFLIIFNSSNNEEVTDIFKNIQSTIEDGSFSGLKIRVYMGLYFLSSKEILSTQNCCINLYGELETAALMAKSTKCSLYNYNSNDHEREKNVALLEQKILNAISLKQFEMFYQPQYDNKFKVVSFEALLRLWDGNNYISPMEIIELAEKKGLMGLITRQIIDIVFKDFSTNDVFKNRRVSINISPDQLVEEGFKEFVIDKIQEYSVDASRVVFEITETTLFNDIESTSTSLRFFRDLGIRISIDDFGTGYSSLFRFIEHEIDEVKYDKSFIDNISNYKTYLVMQKTIELFKDFKIRIVVEGVEEKEQMEMMKDLKIDLYQGFLFNKPSRIEDFSDIDLNGGVL